MQSKKLKNKKKITRKVYFYQCFSLNSLSYSLSFVLLNNAELQAFYRYKVLGNQGIKLIQGNPNLTRKTFYHLIQLTNSQLVNRFNLLYQVTLYQLVDRFLTGRPSQSVLNRLTKSTNFQKLVYFQHLLLNLIFCITPNISLILIKTSYLSGL